MSNTGLTSWQQRNQYYKIVELGKTSTDQAEIISKSSQNMIKAQMDSANSIVASNERIEEGISDLGYSINEVANGIFGLKAAFEWGISEVIWQIEQTRHTLKDILEVLNAPLDTQAKELRKRAEKAYANALHDDALIDFLESENKNRYDFSVHISIGMIYLFHLKNRDKALEYFEKAIKYARAESPYHTSYALLYKGLIYRDLGRLTDAEQCSSKAIEYSPEFLEAWYQNAQYNSQLGNFDNGLISLEKAIRNDRNYALKSDQDILFNPMRKKVGNLIISLRDDAYVHIHNLLNIITRSIKCIDDALRIYGGDDKLSSGKKEFEGNVSAIKGFIDRNSYFDALDGLRNAKDLIPKVKSILYGIENKLDNEIKLMQKDLNEKITECKVTGSMILFVGLFSSIGAPILLSWIILHNINAKLLILMMMCLSIVTVVTRKMVVEKGMSGTGIDQGKLKEAENLRDITRECLKGMEDTEK